MRLVLLPIMNKFSLSNDEKRKFGLLAVDITVSQ